MLQSFAPTFEVKGRDLWMAHGSTVVNLGRVVPDDPLPGKDGAKGDKGDEGRSIKGDPGPKGEAGPKGDAGAPGEDGQDGKDGRGIARAFVSTTGHLVIEYTDGEKQIAGLVRGADGKSEVVYMGGGGTIGDHGSGGGGAVAWDDITDKPATFPPEAHTHDIADVTGLQDALDALQGATGSGVLAFGSAPGGNVATLTVTGQTGIAEGSAIRAWVQGSTADHNAYEHALILPGRIGLGIGDVIAGTGFTVYAETELRLTGSVAVKWEWK